MVSQQWVRLPSAWIRQRYLKHLRWGNSGTGSDNVAALMAMTAIAHHADQETGVTRITYDELCEATTLSRAKLSNGLDVLEGIHVVERTFAGRSSYKLVGFNPKSDWAKFPAKSMYAGGRIVAFDDFRLRQRSELDALKLFFLFVAFRDNSTNLANISFVKIEEYTGIERARIKAATSLLASSEMTYIERTRSSASEYGVANAYRVVGIEPYVHMGTRGRGMDEFDFEKS
jgi:hypothetical protein